MRRVRKNRMKRWNRQRTDDRNIFIGKSFFIAQGSYNGILFIFIGQLLHQREAETHNMTRAIDDDIIHVSTMTINDPIDGSIGDNPTLNTSSLLNDAMYDLCSLFVNSFLSILLYLNIDPKLNN